MHASSNQLDTKKHVKYNEEFIQGVISRPTGRPHFSRPRPRPDDNNTTDQQCEYSDWGQQHIRNDYAAFGPLAVTSLGFYHWARLLIWGTGYSIKVEHNTSIDVAYRMWELHSVDQFSCSEMIVLHSKCSGDRRYIFSRCWTGRWRASDSFLWDLYLPSATILSATASPYFVHVSVEIVI